MEGEIHPCSSRAAFGLGSAGEPAAGTGGCSAGNWGWLSLSLQSPCLREALREPGPCGCSAVAHLKPIFCSWALTDAAGAPQPGSRGSGVPSLTPAGSSDSHHGCPGKQSSKVQPKPAVRRLHSTAFICATSVAGSAQPLGCKGMEYEGCPCHLGQEAAGTFIVFGERR